MVMDLDVSPYLQRPTRSLEEVLRQREERRKRIEDQHPLAAERTGPAADNVVPISILRRPFDNDA